MVACSLLGMAPGVVAVEPELKAGVVAGGVGRTGSGAAGVLPGWLGFHIENLCSFRLIPSLAGGVCQR